MSNTIFHRSEASILRSGIGWMNSGEKVVLATVASTWGSSPRPVGSIMILTNAGHSVGSVSGGCIEEELLATISTNFPKSFHSRIFLNF